MSRADSPPNTYVVGKTNGQTRRLPCNHCGGSVTKHTVRASTRETEYVADPGAIVGAVDTEYEIVQCDGCGNVSFHEFWCTSNEDPESDAIAAERSRVFPPRLEGRRPLTRITLPSNIDTIYRETHTALCGGSEILAGIGIRAVVEAVCQKNGAKRGSLEQKIDKLVASGVLAANDAKVLHRLRDLGNDAAHRIRPVASTKLAVAMDVVEHLLQRLYVVDDARVRKQLPRKRKGQPRPKRP